MTSQKDFKRLVRGRMEKTGESYTAARSQLLRKRGAGPASPAPKAKRPTASAPIDVSKAGMSDAAVRSKTGRTWAEWVAVLDAAGAAQMTHRDIAQYLHEEHSVPEWWTQTVTVGYERIRGLRDVGQRRGGDYETNKSKTVGVPLARLFDAFLDARQRRKWLGAVDLEIRRATANKTMRITWDDATNVQVQFTAKGPDKSQVAIQHGKIASKSRAEELKRYWTEKLDGLAKQLEAPPAPRTRKKTAR
jgi:hypothetical protein